ncbi:hypothetical protein FDJ58_gp150 [Bacillus phage SIOphi]|uniref:Uncharacterized protein n=2 Tax=root TaxID=1 RepID=R4JF37_9CAUD|nr:hypothetical protein FDJ58_gp150 [Bacillus phage SIOphi]AGK86958.1 hypothetical protein SIOphi_00750 [Bacillus phage SIOphi]
MIMNLVRYAGDYWITLADYTKTRDTEGYSDHASVKAAIRTYVVKQSQDRYIAFRGENQIKNIIQENRHNKLFNPEDFEGHTRTALIHWSMLDTLNNRFKVDASQEEEFNEFVEEARKVVSQGIYVVDSAQGTNEDTSAIEGRSSILRDLRSQLTRLEKEIETKTKNKEKILQAINALESMQPEDF